MRAGAGRGRAPTPRGASPEPRRTACRVSCRVPWGASKCVETLNESTQVFRLQTARVVSSG